MKNPTITKPIFAALTGLAFAVPCSAATLAFYDIESNLTQASSAPLVTGLTASAIDATSADGTSANFKFLGDRIPYWFSNNVNTDTGSGPGVGDILATFSLTPDSGQQIELGTAGVFDIGVLAYQNGGDYSATVRLFVASDSAFTNILATSTTITDVREAVGGDAAPTLTSATSGTANNVNYVGLLGLDNAVTSASILYFGIAMVDNTSDAGRNARFDGVGVYGNVSPVPEPSTSLLVAFAGSALFLRRRRA